MLSVYVDRRCSEELFEVRPISQTGETISVSLGTNECSCRKWLLTGLPCVHAISAMRYMELDIYQFVPECYMREKYEACYRPILQPVNGKSLWERTSYTDLQPPPIKRQAGRPKKNGRKDPSELLKDEGKMKKAYYGTKCSRCSQTGHNKATCKLPPPPPVENTTPDNPPPAHNQTTSNPLPASQQQSTTTNPLPASQQQSGTQASSNAQPSGSSQANKQPAKKQAGKTQVGSNSQAAKSQVANKKRGPSNTTKNQASNDNTKRQKLPFKRGPPGGAAGPTTN